VSLDEREAMLAAHPTHPAHAVDTDDDGSFFFDPDPDSVVAAGGHHSVNGALSDDREPAGITHFPPSGGRHARHAAVAEPEPDAGFGGAGSTMTATLLQAPPRRSLEREGRRRRRRRGLLVAIALVIVLVVAGAGWVGYQSLKPTKVADWTGSSGTGSVDIQVKSGDGAQAIGETMSAKGVVASTAAFTRAAARNDKVSGIGPGVYQMRLHMSGAAAVSLLVDPKTHLVAKMTVIEGNLELNVITKVAAALKVPEAKVAAAAADIANLGLPNGYAPASGPLTSAEGFLYPDTYAFDPGTTPADALQAMTSEFTSEDYAIKFADGAKSLGVTPYQALIIASIAQGEVKFASDVPKVVRVILNRLAINKPLQIDATSVYAAEIAGLDPAKVQYDTIVSPYNSYLHTGLPPTPIGNPGEAVLKETITPVAGDWLYYVNGDAAGHLFFTNDPNAFETAVQACRTNNWGC
jgi:UPF0755 protein